MTGLGVEARPLSRALRGPGDPALTPDERRRIARRLGGALAAGVLLAAGWLHRLAFPGQDEIAALLLALGALVAVAPVLRAGLAGFVARDPGSTVDQLVSLALLAALALGDFETAILVPLVMEVGHFLEERSVRGARAAIEALKTLRPTTAARLEPRGETPVAVDQLRPGDHVVVRPGEAFPADGRVRRGASAVDQSTMTGESVPEDVMPGARVFAGTLNLSGVLHVEVTELGDATAIGRIVEILRQAEGSKAPLVRAIERYAQFYLPGVLLVAVAVVVVTQDLGRAVTLLVVSCPCALLLASPSAMTAALAVAARLGVLIKSTRFLERMGDIETVVLDKTGTVTAGRLEVVAVEPVAPITGRELLAEAAVCAAGSRHPVSRGVVAAAGSVGTTGTEGLTEVPGRGVVARRDGVVLRLGSAAWLRDEGLDVRGEPEHDGPVVWLARDRTVLGHLRLADRARPGGREALEALRVLGVTRILLVTGDRPEVAARIAGELGVDEWQAGCLPEAKLRIVKNARTGSRGVMVVGDGVNDALALRGADVGVAMGAMGSAVAVSSADVALMGVDLGRLPETIRLARQTLRIVNENVLLAVGLSLVVMTVAGLGLIGPLAGATVQNLGALAVVVNSGRLLRFEPRVAGQADADGAAGRMVHPSVSDLG